jgi:hypothetical protein
MRFMAAILGRLTRIADIGKAARLEQHRSQRAMARAVRDKDEVCNQPFRQARAFGKLGDRKLAIIASWIYAKRQRISECLIRSADLPQGVEFEANLVLLSKCTN